MSEISSRGMTLRYFVALGLIALLTIASHFVLTETLRVNQGSAAIINMSGRQRMLSQRIGGLALELHLGERSAQEPLRTAIRQFGEAHQKLAALAPSEDRGSITERRLHDAYYGTGEVNRSVHDFLAAARRVANRTAAQHQANSRGDEADLKLLSSLSRGPLLAGLEDVVSIHQSTSEARSQRMERIQWSILIIVLMTLVFEAFFIFRPMVQSISGYVGQLLNLADHDYLTGLLNRRAFTTRAETEIQRCRRYGRKLSLLVLDVDHFKRINDKHGHLAGDSVLVALAQFIDMQARREDLVGRIGGEEFAILLPETELASALEVAGRLCSSVAAQPLEVGDLTLSASISVGVAQVDLSAPRALVTALSRADKMLYQAKGDGRNCVRPQPASARSLQLVTN